MNKFLLAVTLQFVAFFSAAQDSLPLYEYIEEDARKPWFSSSITSGYSGFDSWTINSGYHYPVLKNINVYLATEMRTATNDSTSTKGLLSGIQYSFNEKLSFESSVQAEHANEETVGIVGMGSKLQLTEHLNVEARFDYSLNQEPSASAQYQLGVGYRF
ncbi:hypothetical protein [Enterovibrio norvegicus]|uniref:hypothetical protein n=1 Tax=Enterovibrio norvegicus TaxID=188144 RepID=UPI00352E53CB